MQQWKGRAPFILDELWTLSLTFQNVVYSIPPCLPSGQWSVSFCCLPHGFREGCIVLKIEAINSEQLLLFSKAVPPELMLQLSVCWEVEFVTDRHPNGEVRWLQQLHYVWTRVSQDSYCSRIWNLECNCSWRFLLILKLKITSDSCYGEGEGKSTREIK